MFKSLKDTFNPYTPISVKEFLTQQYWVVLVGLVLGILGTVLEKNNTAIEIMRIYVIFLLFLTVYIEFIFTVKRYRAMNLPPVWACFVFLLPLNVLAFIVATCEKDWLGKYFTKLRYFIREGNDE